MNLALGSLLIFLLVIPGAVFRIFLIKSESFENPLDTSRLAEITFILIPALLLHYFGYTYISEFQNQTVYLDQIYYLIAGDASKEVLDFKDIITPSFKDFLEYIAIMCLVAGCLGYLFKKVLLFLYWDLKFNIAITNEWDNLLSSREFLFERKKELWFEFRPFIFRLFRGRMSLRRFTSYFRLFQMYYRNLPVDWIQVDLLVRATSTDYLYRGTLKKYFLSRGNALDKIYLQTPFKKEHKGLGKENDFNEITSDILILNGEDIININVTYMYWEIE